jgi:ABC-type transport system substrate-binding protein
MSKFPKNSSEKPPWLLLVCALSVVAIWLAGCSGLSPSPGEESRSTSADYPQEPDTDQPYPVRLYLDEMGASILPPPDLEFQETATVEQPLDMIDPVSGARMGSFAIEGGTAQGDQEAAFQAIEILGGKTPLEVAVDQRFKFEDGSTGWHVEGTFESDDGNPEAIAVVAREVLGGHLIVHLQNPGFSEKIRTAFITAAASLEEIPDEPVQIDRRNALYISSGEPLTLDPALTHFGAAGLMGDIFSGLVVLDPHLQIRPALAQSWEISEDGRVYTFHLHSEARFHNGRLVTADDVRFSWERAAHTESDSETVMLYMGDVIGLEAYHRGDADAISGLEILDPHTIQVTIDGPKPYFLAKLAYPVSWIVDRFNVEYPNWEDHPNGTGPFKHLQHREDEVFILERNPFYYGEPPRLDYVVYQMYAGYPQRLYETDQIDMTGITRDQLARAQNPEDGLYGNVISTTGLCTSFVTFNNRLPPFDDPLVRNAFALAIDRSHYVEALTDNEALPGRGLLPPGMPGVSDDPVMPPYDPDLAIELLNESEYFGETSTPPTITWTLPTSGGRYSPAAAFLVDVWEQNLGVSIQVEGIDWESYYQKIDRGEYGHLLFEGWCADYPDPENFLDLLYHSGSSQNHAHYHNPDFDQLIEAARAEPDFQERLSLYRVAEQLLINDAPGVFLNHSAPHHLVLKPHIRGFVPTPINVPQHAILWLEY